ncbi:UNVERIFIED_ORG: hypothetical protein M2328_006089 [Rhodococcus erythropolis]
MSSITADEYRTAAKVDRHHGGQSAAQFYEDNARALESEDLVTQVAMQFAGSTWGGRDAEEQFALAGSERALAYLVGAGRLVPAGGMALTAEQVEDVRAAREELRGYRNFTGYGRSHVNQLIAAVDALFPATEPAEDAPCAICNVNETNHAGVSYYHPFTTEPGPFDDDGNDRPAPAEPAEVETKAELCAVRLCVLPARHSGVHADREGLRWNNPASSPVVPAPTETGPWQRIEDVPETVGRLTDRDGDVWEWDGDNWVTPETAILPTAYINKHFAPFVAAEEG